MLRPMRFSDILPLIGFFAVCFATACSGAVFKPGDWYENLAKPAWKPPNWLFPPVWSVLFTLIAIAGWLAWRQVGFGLPLVVYGIHLLLNAGWSALFFGLKRPDLAFAELVVFWLSILATILLFAPVSAAAAWLLAPYLAWVTFAGMLNYAIWQRNREAGFVRG
ncbi:MAG: CrtK [Belnapia sp.]|nr:CrtK [Belnapia sp.]